MKRALALVLSGLVMACAFGQGNPARGVRRPPKLQLFHEVNLSTFWHQAIIRQLAFSPDSQYVAVKLDPVLGTTELVIVEVLTGKKISTLRSPEYLGMSQNDRVQWLDNQVVFLGSYYRWNALSGERLADAPVVGWQAIFNQDRTQLATVENVLGTPSYLHVYDTKTWSDKKIYADGLSIGTIAWTSDDHLVMSVGVTRKSMGKTIAGHQIGRGPDVGPDVALLLFDPQSQQFIKSLWFPARARKTAKGIEWDISADLMLGISCFGSNSVTLSVNKILDGRTFDIKQFYSDQQVKSNSVAMVGGQACSADGRFLFIKDVDSWDGRHKASNSIIDLALSRQVASFPGGKEEIASSENGQFLAFGGKKGISIFLLNGE
ncbi:WD40 repeat domain-containing protein [Rugamonas rivuli]|uniref:WD40 repeat domain-containing protein n=1 Tax=Rugamonas rivuli TaxID=2743358 RepID=A0A843S4E1_9BURK|nr:hypothetical protein [Rugamonas rivuli]MQA18979.1 hypothetical protein [Rugamonas rivuli]